MNNPFDFFDAVYCLNLKDRNDRWEACLKMADEYGISLNRVEGLLVANKEIPSKRRGQIGCAFSFANKFFDILVNSVHNKVLFFEDDFSFNLKKEDLNTELNKCLQELPKDWDLFFLGCNLTGEHGINPVVSWQSENLLKVNSAHCLHAVAFSRKGLGKIWDFFNYNFNWQYDLINNYEAIDIFFAKEYLRRNKCFMPRKSLLCFQRPDFSNIENAHYDYNEWMIDNFNKYKV
jgi:hypothetical protein